MPPGYKLATGPGGLFPCLPGTSSTRRTIPMPSSQVDPANYISRDHPLRYNPQVSDSSQVDPANFYISRDHPLRYNSQASDNSQVDPPPPPASPPPPPRPTPRPIYRNSKEMEPANFHQRDDDGIKSYHNTKRYDKENGRSTESWLEEQKAMLHPLFKHRRSPRRNNPA